MAFCVWLKFSSSLPPATSTGSSSLMTKKLKQRYAAGVKRRSHTHRTQTTQIKTTQIKGGDKPRSSGEISVTQTYRKANTDACFDPPDCFIDDTTGCVIR